MHSIPITYKINRSVFLGNLCKKWIGIGIIMLLVINLYGQVPSVAPKDLKVYSVQELSFGSFCITNNSGGTVQISPQGVRSCSGDITAMPSFSGSPAIFNIRLVQGRMVHMIFPVSAILFQFEGEGSMEITNFISDKEGGSFVTSAAHPFMNAVKVGATLNVGSITQNPSGNYRGTFTVIFARE